MASQLLAYKFVAHYLGTTGFYEYALVRRIVSLLQPAVLLGIGVGLPRFVAISGANDDAQEQGRFFGAATWCVGAAVSLAVTVLLVWQHWFAYLFFGSADYSGLIPALCLLVVGISLHGLGYAFFRGRMLISRANWLNLLNLGAVPLAVLVFFHRTVVSTLWWLALGWTTTALIALIWTPMGTVLEKHAVERRKLLTYGLQRVPGDFILMALLALPAILAAHVAGIQLAGYVAFGVSAANMIASAFAPVSILLLPKVSGNLKTGKIAGMRPEIQAIGWSAVVIPLVLIGLVELFAPFLIHVYLGRDFLAAGHVVRILVVAALPLSVYYALRSVIDAFYERAVNTASLFFSLMAFLVVSSLWLVLGVGIDIGLWAFVLGSAMLAMLTVLALNKALPGSNVVEVSSGS